MSTILICTDPLDKLCRWSGDESELVSSTDDTEDRDFSHCPQCGGTDFDEEDEEDVEKVGGWRDNPLGVDDDV